MADALRLRPSGKGLLLYDLVGVNMLRLKPQGYNVGLSGGLEVKL